jgi:transcriptional regulator GlxA family with amidase domain
MKVGILVFDDAEELDFVGPWEVFTAARMLAGDVEVITIAERLEPVRAAKGLRVIPHATLENAGQVDILVVPGGQGARLRESENPRMLGYVRDAATHCRWITSVCTGAMVLHAAGLLKGKRATTHWAYCDQLEARGDVTVLRNVRYVRDGNVVTSAGVSAGIDMSLWLVGQVLGRDVARNVQRTMEYDPAPPYAAEA